MGLGKGDSDGKPLVVPVDDVDSVSDLSMVDMRDQNGRMVWMWVSVCVCVGETDVEWCVIECDALTESQWKVMKRLE